MYGSKMDRGPIQKVCALGSSAVLRVPAGECLGSGHSTKKSSGIWPGILVGLHALPWSSAHFEASLPKFCDLEAGLLKTSNAWQIPGLVQSRRSNPWSQDLGLRVHLDVIGRLMACWGCHESFGQILKGHQAPRRPTHRGGGEAGPPRGLASVHFSRSAAWAASGLR